MVSGRGSVAKWAPTDWFQPHVIVVFPADAGCHCKRSRGRCHKRVAIPESRARSVVPFPPLVSFGPLCGLGLSSSNHCEQELSSCRRSDASYISLQHMPGSL